MTAKTLWRFLVLYTILYGILFGFQSSLLPELLRGEASPFATQFFNLMGLVPGYFLLDYLSHGQWSWRKFFPFLFGFIGGAYAILLGYRQPMRPAGPVRQRPIRIILILVMIFLTLWLMIIGIASNTMMDYLGLFFADSLVGIMTMDFFVLYVWTIIRSTQISSRWWLSFLPIIGFGFVLIFGQD
jgi:hypothetical protein